MDDQIASIRAVEPRFFAGRVVPLTDDGRTSAIAKSPVAGPWTITHTGLVGDEQADLESHGGREKALHHYPYDHYAAWRTEIGPHILLDTAGAFGENFSTSGWTEANVHLGDVVRIGPAVLQVSQGRKPCWKLNARFERKTMARDVQISGRTGWYYRVLVPGIVGPGDVMSIVERPYPNWPLSRLGDVFFRNVNDFVSLAEMADMDLLAEAWRSVARKRLATRMTEDWTTRLDGPDA